MNILVFNQKGGVGKTTTALNLAAALAQRGRQVLLVDLDPQTHLSAAVGHKAVAEEWNVSKWLAGQPGEPLPLGKKLALVPGDPEPPDNQRVGTIPHQELVILDGPPSWNNLIGEIMTQADCILTPLEPDFLGMQGLNRLFMTLRRNNISWGIVRLLLCRYDQRLKIHQEVRERMTQRFRSLLLPVAIRNSVRLAEAHGYGKTIFDYAPQSAGAEDYQELARILTSTLLADDGG